MQDLELWCYLQRAIERQIFRRPSHHDLEVAWNHAPVHVNIQQLEIFRAQRESYRFCFARFQVYLLKSAQLFYRDGNRGRILVDIKLHCFPTHALAAVLHLHADSSPAAWVDLRRLDAQVGVLIICEAESEGRTE